MNIGKKHDNFSLIISILIMFFAMLLFSGYSDTRVDEDDLFGYAETYLKTYKDVIDTSNLAHDDFDKFPFYQGYPYSANAIISTSHGASIFFISNSTSENTTTKISYPIEESIYRITEEEKKAMNIGLLINANNSIIKNVNIGGSYILIESSFNSSFCKIEDNTPILLAEGMGFEGVTYIDSNNVAREGNLTINGTLVLDNSKVIIKGSNLKADWTKEKAKSDSIDLIYKEQIENIYDYSKLTGLGYFEIETLVQNYKDRESMGYYKTNTNDKWHDRQEILDKAAEYGIPQESVVIELSTYKDEKTSYEKTYEYIDDALTIRDIIFAFIGIFGWIKRKSLSSRLKKILKIEK